MTVKIFHNVDYSKRCLQEEYAYQRKTFLETVLLEGSSPVRFKNTVPSMKIWKYFSCLRSNNTDSFFRGRKFKCSMCQNRFTERAKRVAHILAMHRCQQVQKSALKCTIRYVISLVPFEKESEKAPVHDVENKFKESANS